MSQACKVFQRATPEPSPSLCFLRSHLAWLAWLASLLLGSNARTKSSSWEEGAYFSLHLHVTVHHWRKSEQKVKKNQAEAIEECCLWTCSLADFRHLGPTARDDTTPRCSEPYLSNQ